MEVFLFVILFFLIIFLFKHVTNKNYENAHIKKFLHEHPEYELNEWDFLNHPHLGKVSFNDIAWGIFNQRILNNFFNWKNQEKNYANMANLLIEEKKFKDALGFLFKISYIEASGCIDDRYLYYAQNGYDKNDIPIEASMFKINNSIVTKNFYIIQKNLNLDIKEIYSRYINNEGIEGLQSFPFSQYFDVNQSYQIFLQAIKNKNFSGYFIPDLDKISREEYIDFSKITEKINECFRLFAENFDINNKEVIISICKELLKVRIVTDSHILNFHNTTNYIVNRIYPKININSEYKDLCIQLCEKDIESYSKITEDKKYLTKFSTLTKLCILLEKNNQIKKAIKFCEIGMSNKCLDSNGKSFEIRKGRLLKKIDKYNS